MAVSRGGAPAPPAELWSRVSLLILLNLSQQSAVDSAVCSGNTGEEGAVCNGEGSGDNAGNEC